MYPVSPGDDGIKIQPEKMEKEKLYHCIFKDKVVLFYKDVQDVLNCFEIEEENLVQKIKELTNKDEIEKLKQDAEKFADEDKKKKEDVELKNEAESYIYATEKLVNQDLKDKISQEQGIKITDAMKELKESLDKGPAEIKPKLDALKQIVNEVSTEIYKKVTPPPGADQQSGTGQQTDSDTEQKSAESNQTTNQQKEQEKTNNNWVDDLYNENRE